METRANYAIIGMFTIAVIVSAFGFVYWFAGSQSGVERKAYMIRFTDSIAGLSKGSPVLFNGIRVGDVTMVRLDPDDPQVALARIEVAKDTPIKEDTKASLDTAILSGTAVIALTGGSKDKPEPAKTYPDPDDDKLADDKRRKIALIRAQSGGLASILETARNTTDRANALLDNLNALVSDNRATLQKSVNDLEAFTGALARNAPAIDGLLSSVASAATKVPPLADKLAGLTDSATQMLSAVEPDRLRNAVRNIEGVTQTLDEGRTAIAGLLTESSSLATRLNASAPKLDQVLSGMSQVFATIDTVKLNQTIDGASRFAAKLADSADDFQSTARNSSQLTAKLNASADRIDGVLKSVQDFLGSAAGREGQSTFESIRVAMDSFRRASDNLSNRATEISQNVGRFAGVGSRQVEALGGDARRAVNTVGRAARNLERNPSSVIFGSGRAAIPEFSGR